MTHLHLCTAYVIFKSVPHSMTPKLLLTSDFKDVPHSMIPTHEGDLQDNLLVTK